MTSVCYFAGDVPGEWLTWGAHAACGSVGIRGALCWVSRKIKQTRAPSSSRSQLLPGSTALGWSRHMRSITQDEVSEAKQAAPGLPKFRLNLGLVSYTEICFVLALFIRWSQEKGSFIQEANIGRVSYLRLGQNSEKLWPSTEVFVPRESYAADTNIWPMLLWVVAGKGQGWLDPVTVGTGPIAESGTAQAEQRGGGENGIPLLSSAKSPHWPWSESSHSKSQNASNPPVSQKCHHGGLRTSTQRGFSSPCFKHFTEVPK